MSSKLIDIVVASDLDIAEGLESAVTDSQLSKNAAPWQTRVHGCSDDF